MSGVCTQNGEESPFRQKRGLTSRNLNKKRKEEANASLLAHMQAKQHGPGQTPPLLQGNSYSVRPALIINIPC